MIGRTFGMMLAALLAACSEREPAPAEPANAAAPANAASPAPAPVAAQYEPWEDPSCHMILKDKSDGTHTAWISAGDTGVGLVTHLEARDTLPHSVDLGLRLRADGDPKREVAAGGERGHEDTDGENIIGIILDKPQRALIDSAERIAVMRGATTLIELPVDTLADLESVAESCTKDPDKPGKFEEE